MVVHNIINQLKSETILYILLITSSLESSSFLQTLFFPTIILFPIILKPKVECDRLEFYPYPFNLIDYAEDGAVLSVFIHLGMKDFKCL
jgi:hypothetical protein